MRPAAWPAAAAAVGVTASAVASLSFLPPGLSRNDSRASPDLQLLGDVLEALQTMQDGFFEPWLGTWPRAIDWTAAVMGSHVSGALTSLSRALGSVPPLRSGDDGHDHRLSDSATENVIALYFSQLVASYFGQNALAIRHEAFDDILWVVLGWLDTTQFIDLHTTLHFRSDPTLQRLLQGNETGAGATPAAGPETPRLLRNQTWHGNIWTPAFAHRARVFWELSSKGWDDVLCGGGMTWNPRLEPYKNAVTNELFVSASMAMYIHFPGDSNPCPYSSLGPAMQRGGGGGHDEDPPPDEPDRGDWKPHDPRYLKFAADGYEWLMASNMTNRQGLFTDGFHISGYRNASDPNTKCDLRNEMVYTYNQGIILSGQLGLFQATTDTSYLADGHRLVQNVIAATGYDLVHDRPADDDDDDHHTRPQRPGELPRWRGLGRAGVLEDVCDVRGDCSQNAHTFKGIFFHHLAAFCSPLEPLPESLVVVAGQRQRATAAAAARDAHRAACRAYLGWLRHNAAAAMGTRDDRGRFGMWWTAGLLRNRTDNSSAWADADRDGVRPSGAVDYRNDGVPVDDPVWQWRPSPPPEDEDQQRPLLLERRNTLGRRDGASVVSDPNERGRGRTVETQGSGLALLRALWEVSRHTWE